MEKKPLSKSMRKDFYILRDIELFLKENKLSHEKLNEIDMLRTETFIHLIRNGMSFSVENNDVIFKLDNTIFKIDKNKIPNELLTPKFEYIRTGGISFENISFLSEGNFFNVNIDFNKNKDNTNIQKEQHKETEKQAVKTTTIVNDVESQEDVEFKNPVSKPAIESENTDEWICPHCGETNNGMFCEECGTKKPKPKKKNWVCPNCGNENHKKFCKFCGYKYNEKDFENKKTPVIEQVEQVEQIPKETEKPIHHNLADFNLKDNDLNIDTVGNVKSQPVKEETQEVNADIPANEIKQKPTSDNFNYFNESIDNLFNNDDSENYTKDTKNTDNEDLKNTNTNDEIPFSNESNENTDVSKTDSEKNENVDTEELFFNSFLNEINNNDLSKDDKTPQSAISLDNNFLSDVLNNDTDTKTDFDTENSDCVNNDMSSQNKDNESDEINENETINNYNSTETEKKESNIFNDVDNTDFDFSFNFNDENTDDVKTDNIDSQQREGLQETTDNITLPSIDKGETKPNDIPENIKLSEFTEPDEPVETKEQQDNLDYANNIDDNSLYNLDFDDILNYDTKQSKTDDNSSVEQQETIDLKQEPLINNINTKQFSLNPFNFDKPKKETEPVSHFSVRSNANDTDEMFDELLKMKNEQERTKLFNQIKSEQNSTNDDDDAFDLITGEIIKKPTDIKVLDVEMIAKQVVETNKQKLLENQSIKTKPETVETTSVNKYNLTDKILKMQAKTDKHRHKDNFIFNRTYGTIDIQDKNGKTLVDDILIVAAPLSIPENGTETNSDACIMIEINGERQIVTNIEQKGILRAETKYYKMLIRPDWINGNFETKILFFPNKGNTIQKNLSEDNIRPDEMSEQIGIGHNVLYLDYATKAHIIPIDFENEHNRADFFIISIKKINDTVGVKKFTNGYGAIVDGEKYNFKITGSWNNDILNVDYIIPTNR